MKIVKVTWHDALAVACWTKADQPMEPQTCTTVGFLVAEDAAHVLIAATISDDEYTAGMQIPRAMIQQMCEIG